MNNAIRLSPSGPVITGDLGGPFAPGTGARLRLVQSTCTGGEQQIPTTPVGIGPLLGTDTTLASLALPNPGLHYTARVRCDVSNPSTANATVDLFLDTSEDGLTWTNQATNTHIITGGGTTHNGAREISLDMVLTSGAAVGVTASPQSPRLYVRGRISATSAGGTPLFMLLNSPISGHGNDAGTILLELEEML